MLCAPAAPAQQLRLGVRAGGNLTNGIGADARGSSLRFGYHAGALLQVRATERWSLQPEVLHAVKGDAAADYGPSLGARLIYLEVPLLARFTLDDGFIEAGPYAAYRLHTKYNDDALTIPARITPYQNLDYGLAIGFGYQDPDGLSVSWRYTTGLRNVYRPVAFSDAFEHVRLRHNSLSISFGYLLPWKWRGPL